VPATASARTSRSRDPDFRNVPVAFMPAVIPAANDAMMEIAGLMRIQLDPA
jgi:hypothetical protein